MIKLECVSTGYRQKRGYTVLASGLDVSLENGTLACLVGENGSGKSTLLRTMAGLLPPLAGEVLSDGHNIYKVEPSVLSRTVSIVLPTSPLTDRLTVFDVVSLGRSPYTGMWGSIKDSDRSVIEDSLDKVSASGLRNRYVDSLSDGERQRVMIAKALAQQTPTILMDEPSAFLDWRSKKQLMSLLQHLAHEEGKAILLSTHDLAIASGKADLFWSLSGGSLTVSRDISLD